MRNPAITAVVFDIGETLLDRTREYAAWAEFFGVPAHTFSAVFGAMISRGSRVAEVIESFGSGEPYPELLARRAAEGIGARIEEQDLYPDVRDAISSLTAAGFTGIRPARAGDSEDPKFAAVEEASRWVDAVGIQCYG